MARSIPCDCGGWAIYRRRDDGMAYLDCNKCGGVFELNVPWNEKQHGYGNINKSISTKSTGSTGLKSAGWWGDKNNQMVAGYAVVGGLVGLFFLGLWGVILGGGLGWFIGVKAKKNSLMK